MVGFNSLGKWLAFSVKNNQKTLLFKTTEFNFQVLTIFTNRQGAPVVQLVDLTLSQTCYYPLQRKGVKTQFCGFDEPLVDGYLRLASPVINKTPVLATCTSS